MEQHCYNDLEVEWEREHSSLLYCLVRFVVVLEVVAGDSVSHAEVQRHILQLVPDQSRKYCLAHSGIVVREDAHIPDAGLEAVRR